MKLNSMACGRTGSLVGFRTVARFGGRYLQRHPWQTILMIIGIMLGVSVVVAIDLANESASRAFDLSTDMVAGRATHQVLGGPTGLEEETYVRLRQDGANAPIAPVVSEYISSPRMGDRPLQLLGIDPFAEAPFRSYLAGSDGAAVGRNASLTPFFTVPGAVLLSVDLAELYSLTVGDEITLEVAGFNRQATIAGLLEPADSLSRRALAGMVLADIATAQELTGRTGTLDRIDLILPEEDESTRARLEAMLPPGSQIVETAARSGALEQMTAAFRTNLIALSLLALIVGLFLIYNTMTFSVVQRRPLFGTLRALGVTRNEVFGLVVGEALLAGIVGTAGGLLLGVLLGQGAVRLVSQTINDLYFVVSVRDVAVPVSTLIRGGLLGVAATILAAAPPAWEAASVPPRLALSRSGLEAKAGRAVSRAAVAGVLLAMGGAVLLLVPTDNLIVSFGGTFAIIVGFAMLTPLLTSVLMRGLTPISGRIGGTLGRMAPRNVVSSLSRTSVAVAALMIAVSVTIGVTVMISSFRGTVEVWLEQTLRGDIYVSPPAVAGSASSGIIDPQVIDAIETWPGVARVDTFRSVQVETENGPITLSSTRNPTIGSERVFKWVDRPPEEVWPAMENGAVLLSEPLANRLGMSRSDSLSIETPAGTRDYPVIGVYYDYTSSLGTALMARSAYLDQWQDTAVEALSLRLQPGMDADLLSVELEQGLARRQRLQVQPNAGLRAEALAVFDRTFAITSAMQLLSTLVAFVGVLSALLSLQLDKSRQFGILRAVGLTAQQLWRLLLTENGLLGAAAGLLALPTGVVLATILIYIINRRAFGWTLQLQLEAGPFMTAFAVAIIAAVTAGIVPAWRLSRGAAIEAMRRD